MHHKPEFVIITVHLDLCYTGTPNKTAPTAPSLVYQPVRHGWKIVAICKMSFNLNETR